jgi:hypothetical protein
MWKWLKKWFAKDKSQQLVVLNSANVEKVLMKWKTELGIEHQSETTNFPIDEIKGNYSITGSNPGSSKNSYFGQLAIQPHGELVKGTWQIGYDNQQQKGLGFIHKNLLAMDFYYTDDAQRFYGQVIYEMKDEELTGYWVERNVEGIGREQASWLNGLIG